jgi:hypothetical protein
MAVLFDGRKLPPCRAAYLAAEPNPAPMLALLLQAGPVSTGSGIEWMIPVSFAAAVLTLIVIVVLGKRNTV